MRKPFDLLAGGLVSKQSRGDCPSFEPATERIATLASALLEARGPHIDVITALTRTA